MERLQKYIAECGICSRRHAEELITQGRVTVNDIPATLGDKVSMGGAGDVVKLDGEIIKPLEEKITIEIYKPRGVVCTMQDEFGRRCVGDILREKGYPNLYPVGRLDKDSEGLLICTNDGDLALRKSHPRYGHRKTYKVWCSSVPTDEQLAVLNAMRELEGEEINPVVVERQEDYTQWVLSEGKNRQIRRMCSVVGLSVVRLVRIKIE
jgi:pseudouridine synthase